MTDRTFKRCKEDEEFCREVSSPKRSATTSTPTPTDSHSKTTKACEPNSTIDPVAVCCDRKTYITSDLLIPISKPVPFAADKVTVVGAGAVGMACAFTILSKNISSEIALIDQNHDRAIGELKDIQHGTLFLKNAKLSGGSCYDISANSRVIIICAGARQRPGETRLELLKRNYIIFEGMVPKLVKLSPNAVFVVVSNPVDILTYVTWKLSGLPKSRIIGTGTGLDSARFRYLIAEKFKIAVESCEGWILGEHGDSSVPIWSSITIGSVRLRDLNPNAGKDEDPENWNEVHTKVVSAAQTIIGLKGYTSWAIGLYTANLVQTILMNSHVVHACSTNVKGFYEIEEDVCLSMPCVIGANGITHVINKPLEIDDIKRLRISASVLATHIKSLKDFCISTNRPIEWSD